MPGTQNVAYWLAITFKILLGLNCAMGPFGCLEVQCLNFERISKKIQGLNVDDQP